MKAPVRLTLRVGIQNDYTSYLVGAAYELRRRGYAEIEYGRPSSPPYFQDSHAIGWLDCEYGESGEHLRICFDLVDYKELPSARAIESCDIYLKRGFCPDYIKSLPPTHRDKILPLGIHLPSASHQESALDRVRRGIHSRNEPMISQGEVRNLVAAPFRNLTDFFSAPHRCSPDLWASPPTPFEQKRKGVYFRTRVFDPSKSANPATRADLENINQTRISVVRALREEFGSDYMGGIYETEAARKICPQLIHELPAGYVGKRGHLQLSRKYLINVNTIGISGSTPWKFPEVLASGCALVSEPPRFLHQSMPTDGQHYLAFNTPEQCVQACRSLLEKPEEAQALGCKGRAFYEKEIHPPNALLKTLDRIRLHKNDQICGNGR